MNESFPVFGQDGYVELARSLVQGNGFVFEPGGSPVHNRPPLYPLVLTPVVLLPDFLLLPALVLFHSLMLGCIGALLFSIAHGLFGLSVARGAVIIFLANPWLYASVKNPLTPVFQCLLYTAFIYLLGKEILPLLTNHPARARSRFFPPWLLIGSLGGFLSLTHGTLIAVNGASMVLLMLLSLRRRDARLMRTTVLACLVSVLLVAPWTYRNWVAFDRLIPVVGGGGLMYGNQYWHWNQDDLWRETDKNAAPGPKLTVPSLSNPRDDGFHGLTSQALDAELSGKALRHIRSRPGVFVKGLVLNATAYYFPSVAEVFGPSNRRCANMEKVALTIFHLVTWTFVGLGLWHVRKQQEPRLQCLLLLLCVLLYAVWYFPFLTSVNHTMYTFATMQILAILAAVGLVYSRRRVRQSRRYLRWLPSLAIASVQKQTQLPRSAKKRLL